MYELDFVNENDWTRRLGRHPVVLSRPGPVSGSSWAQAHGTHKYHLLPFFHSLINIYPYLIKAKDFREMKINLSIYF